jgi:hypothetical protein
MHTAIKNLIADTIELCEKNGKYFKLAGAPYLRYAGARCSGYCDIYGLTVAIKKDLDEWLLVFIHEAAHLDQVIEESPIWFNEYAETDDINVWVKNKQVKNKNIDKYFKAAIALELDCEKRSVAKIKKYKLPVDVGEYTKKANAYIFSYTVTQLNRKWFEFPYKIPEIYNKMPKRFLKLEDYINKRHPLLSLYNYDLTKKK